MISWLKRWFTSFILDIIADILAGQQKRIDYLSQRVHALRLPTSSPLSIHFPSLDDLIYEYRLFEQTVVIPASALTLQLNINGFGLKTDFRYVGQANHKLYMKLVDEHGKESVWLDCCETVRLVGLVPKDGTFCIRHDKTLSSSSTVRHCIIPSQEIHGRCQVYLRFGKRKQDVISCTSIEITDPT